jgi:peptidyl-prolyl cis-trans isomerase D
MKKYKTESLVSRICFDRRLRLLMKQKLKQKNKFIVLEVWFTTKLQVKNDTLPGFRTTANTIDFVNSNSDVPYDSTYIARKIYLL